MATLAEAAARFLGQRRIAIVGVSRDPKQPANFNYRKLRDSGHTVFAVNPAPTVGIHRGFGQGSWSAEAETAGRELWLVLIPGGCPAMFCTPDPGHRCIRWMFGLFGKLPQEIAGG